MIKLEDLQFLEMFKGTELIIIYEIEYFFYLLSDKIFDTSKNKIVDGIGRKEIQFHAGFRDSCWLDMNTSFLGFVWE